MDMLKDYVDNKISLLLPDERFNIEEILMYLNFFEENHPDCLRPLFREINYYLINARDLKLKSMMIKLLETYEPYVIYANLHRFDILDHRQYDLITCGIHTLFGDLILYGNIVLKILNGISPYGHVETMNLLALTSEDKDNFMLCLSCFINIDAYTQDDKTFIFLKNCPRIITIIVFPDVKIFISTLKPKYQCYIKRKIIMYTEVFVHTNSVMKSFPTKNYSNIDKIYSETNKLSTIWDSDISLLQHMSHLIDQVSDDEEDDFL